MTSEQKELFLKLHKEGWSTKYIYETLGISKSVAYKFIRQNGLKSNCGVTTTPIDVQNIKELYLKGETVQSISEVHLPHLKEGTVNYIVRKLGIARPNGKVCNFNTNYFDEIDTERKAYWLGLLFADGSLIHKLGKKGTVISSTISLTLKSSDEYILEELAKDIGVPCKIYKRELSDFKGYDTISHTSTLKFTSKHMGNTLEKYGMVPRKSLYLETLPTLSPHLMRHFIRGYFDGNGSVYFSQNALRIAIYSTESFVNKLRQYLVETLKINEGKTTNQKEAKVSFTSIGKQQDIRAFYNYIYKDATIYLKRKKDIFDNNL